MASFYKSRSSIHAPSPRADRHVKASVKANAGNGEKGTRVDEVRIEANAWPRR